MTSISVAPLSTALTTLHDRIGERTATTGITRRVAADSVVRR